jgi:hypothetical protein
MEFAIPILFILLAFACLLELLLSIFWLPAYFRHGLRLFHREVLHIGVDAPLLTQQRLTKEFEDIIYPKLVFWSFSPHEIAFRDVIVHMFYLNFHPIMRGIVRKDDDSKVITISGYATWSVLAFLPFFLLVSLLVYFAELPLAATVVLLTPLIITGLLYLKERSVYLRLYRFLAITYCSTGRVSVDAKTV